MRKVRANLIRLGEENPELRKHIRPILAGMEQGMRRTATGERLIWELLDQREVAQAIEPHRGTYTGTLFREVINALSDKLTVDANTTVALNKLRNMLARSRRGKTPDGPEIAELADLLGLRVDWLAI